MGASAALRLITGVSLIIVLVFFGRFLLQNGQIALAYVAFGLAALRVLLMGLDLWRRLRKQSEPAEIAADSRKRPPSGPGPSHFATPESKAPPSSEAPLPSDSSIGAPTDSTSDPGAACP